MTLARLRRIGRHRLRAVFRKERVDDELARELAFHYEALVAEHVDAGLPLQEARGAARRAIGNTALFEEECRDQRGVTWLHDLSHDIGYALRLLRNAPLFTAVAVGSLALGIGSSAAVLAAFDAVARQPLPFPDAERIVVVRTAPRGAPLAFGPVSLPDVVAWQQETTAFDEIAVSIANNRDFIGDGSGLLTERINGQLVTPSLFRALGVSALLGRVLDEGDVNGETARPVIVLSHRLWRTRFNGDRSIVGRALRLGGGETTVVGIMPEDFEFPDERSTYWAPLSYARDQVQGSARLFQVTARLRPGVTAAQARDDVARVVSRLADERPERYPDHMVRVDSWREYVFGWTTQPLRIFGAAVALVLLLACTNVAGLLVARSVARAPELSLRVALGAGRARLIRQLLVESLVLSAFGAALGLGVAALWILSVPAWAAPFGVQRPLALTFDLRMLAMLAAVTVLTGVGVGLIPAFGATRRDLIAVARHAGSQVSRRSSTLRDAMVAGQAAIALALLIGSILLGTSLVHVESRPLNVEPEGVITLDYRIPPAEYLRPAGSYRGFPYFDVIGSPAATFEEAIARIRIVPGVQAAAGISHPVMQTILLPTAVLSIDGRAAPASEAEREALTSVHFIATPGLFAALRTPLVAGRELTGDDTAQRQWVAVITETAARHFWPGENAIGKRFTLDLVPEERPREVVGIVRDIPLRRAEVAALPVVYTSYLQQPSRYRGPHSNMFGLMTFMVRASGDPLPLAATIRRELAELHPRRPVSNISLLEHDLERTLTARRLYAFVLAIFAVVATVLAAIGTYGVTAYAVAQRTREIGIRLALGASVRSVIGLVGGRIASLISLGVVAGVTLGAAFARTLRSQLYGVSADDPALYAVVCVLLAVVALAACVAPARRALAVDPTRALRES